MPDAKARQMWMQDLRSLNFEPLRAVFPDLANMGGYAEHYAHSDPESSLVKLRNFAERVVDHVYAAQKLFQHQIGGDHAEAAVVQQVHEVGLWCPD